MRTFGLFSLQHFVLGLVSLSTLAVVHAAPVESQYTALDRRSTTMTIDGKVAELGPMISPANHDKSVVYRLTKWDNKPNPGYVIKIYQQRKDRDSKLNPREIEGLKAAGLYIDSDMNKRAVVMKEVKGKVLAVMVAKLPHDDTRREFVRQWKDKVVTAAAEMAKNKGILHWDLNMNNIIITPDNHVEFIDWEHFYDRTDPKFTDDEGTIRNDVNIVWDSSLTPPGVKKSSSPSGSGHKPPSSKRSPSPKKP